MAKDPAVLLYTSDFLTGNADLNMEERGQLITLLCLHHQKGRLSRKLIDLSVPNVSNDVMGKFNKDDKGLYYNKRLEEEAKKRRKFSQRQSGNAKKRWAKDKTKNNAQEDAMEDATALPLENENENENSFLRGITIKSENDELRNDNTKDIIKDVDMSDLFEKLKKERIYHNNDSEEILNDPDHFL